MSESRWVTIVAAVVCAVCARVLWVSVLVPLYAAYVSLLHFMVP